MILPSSGEGSRYTHSIRTNLLTISVMVGFEFRVISASLLKVTSPCSSMVFRYAICLTVISDNPHSEKMVQEHWFLSLSRFSRASNRLLFSFSHTLSRLVRFCLIIKELVGVMGGPSGRGGSVEGLSIRLLDAFSQSFGISPFA